MPHLKAGESNNELVVSLRLHTPSGGEPTATGAAVPVTGARRGAEEAEPAGSAVWRVVALSSGPGKSRPGPAGRAGRRRGGGDGGEAVQLGVALRVG